jgi:hypothetical protein
MYGAKGGSAMRLEQVEQLGQIIYYESGLLLSHVLNLLSFFFDVRWMAHMDDRGDLYSHTHSHTVIM